LRVGEFQELVFEMRIQFRQPMDDASLEVFFDAFIDLVESRHLAVCGGNDLMKMDGVISAWGRGSPTETDRQALLEWLRLRSEVASAEAGDFIDGWYGREDAE
jgi:uncharacterized protein YggL (DUF469 family)